jgi:hypothetical protein
MLTREGSFDDAASLLYENAVLRRERAGSLRRDLRTL